MDTLAPKNQYLLFYLEEQRVLLAIDSIKMVLPIAALQEVPDQSESFRGMLNFHGKGVPVYDLLQLTNIQKQINIHPDIPLVLGLSKNQEIGLLVSDVDDLIEIEASHLQTPSSDAMPYVKFIYETTDKNAWELDLNGLIDYHQLHLKSEIPNG